MDRNREYSTSKRGDGSFIRRGDGKITYRNQLDPILPPPPGAGLYSVIFVDSLQGVNKLYSIPIAGGSILELVPNFQVNQIKCDPVNRILFWSNASSASGSTYPGDNAIWAVRYDAVTGAFTTDPIQLLEEGGSYTGAFYPDSSALILYYTHGWAMKKGSYSSMQTLQNIEWMDSRYLRSPGDIWKGTTDILYMAMPDIPVANPPITGGCDTMETVRSTGDEYGYQYDAEYYDAGDDMEFIDCDLLNDIMFLGDISTFDVEVMTLSNPIDKTVFLTKDLALYSPHSIDPVTEFFYYNHYNSDKIVRYEYGTRSPVNQTTILDWSDEGLAAHARRMALG